MTFCGAMTAAGTPCKNPVVGDGFTRCRFHGGASSQAKAKAAERVAEKRARRVLEGLEITKPVTDPIGELENIAGQAVALTNLLRGVVADLEQIRYVGGLGQGTENIRGELQAYLSAMTRTESVLAKLVSLNLDERRVRVQEAQAAALVAALGTVLAHQRLDLDEDRQRIGRELLSFELQRRELIA